MGKDVLRALRPGGPCIASAAAACASRRIANTNMDAKGETDVPTESRPLALARSAGLAPV